MFKLSIWNAWLLSLPFFMLGFFFMGLKKDIAKRMSDMTGYTKKEKFFTILASIMPYPFLVATVWTPFSRIVSLLFLGLLFYILGMILFLASLKIIVNTPAGESFRTGPYRFTRNPLYLSATIVFLGICLATANIILVAYLVVATLLQHSMILSEERICREKYGSVFQDYLKTVPRYI